MLTLNELLIKNPNLVFLPSVHALSLYLQMNKIQPYTPPVSILNGSWIEN